MMKVRLPVFSISSFFCYVFVSIFLVNTLVSLPFPLPHQIEILLAFKNEFPPPTCSHTVLSSWTRNTPQNTSSFDGVVFDNETGVVTELHLGEACLRGIIKTNSSLFKFHNLSYLNLSYNDFDLSSFPAEFGRLANLEVFSIRYNGLVGEVPSSIHNLSRLTFLDLSHNKLGVSFPLVCNLTNLSHLDLSYNDLFGAIPSSLLTMPSLLKLDLHQNHLRDPLENLNSSSSSKLESLYLGRNFFSGRILEPVSKLVKLTYLDLSFLNIIYPINIVFLPLKSLKYLDLSGNSLSRLNSSSDHALTKLIGLDLSSCNIVEFPKFLKSLPNLQHLDISNNRLKGKVPGWLWTLPLTEVSLSHNFLNGFEGSPEVLLNSSLEMLDLSSNAFVGSFPILPSTITVMSASNNNFTGDLALSLCSPRKLSHLDLSNNNFSGPIPRCLGDSVHGVMNLRHNNLDAELPDIFCKSGSLAILDVGHNQITGKLPRSLANCTRLTILDVEANNITDTFPFWLKALPLLQVIVLQSNRFYGSIFSPQHPLPFSKLRIIDISRNNFNGSLPPNYFLNFLSNQPRLKNMVDQNIDGIHHSFFSENERQNTELENILLIYTAIDFSGNRFGGQIPESIGYLKSLRVLNLSYNAFTGHIPSSFAKISELESLDLSRNQLSGKIPPELGTLSYLAYINMSHNKLVGQIPQGTQFQTQPESAFEGNVNLCGFPLQKSCLEENGAPSPQTQDLKPSKAATRSYGPTLMMFGLGLGLGHVIASYRPTWFILLFPF